MPASLLEERDGYLYLRVRAAPKASRDAVEGLHGDALKVAVRAAPERGKANAAVCRVVAAALSLRRSQVAVAGGATSRDKRLRIDGVRRAELEARLAALVPGQ